MSVNAWLIFTVVAWVGACQLAWAAEAGRDIIVVAGNFSIDGKNMNVAQYDIVTGQ